MGGDPKETLMQCDERDPMKEFVGFEVMQVHAIEEEKTAEEGVCWDPNPQPSERKK